MVVWIIGYSGSGKTYLASRLLKKIKGKKIHIDGDDVRKFLTYDLKYSLSDRKKNSKFISDLCKFLESKNYYVVCSILSIFREHQIDNRLKLKKYFQIYLQSDFKHIKKRNNKKIYSKSKQVVGVDIKFPKPIRNDLIIKNKFKPFTEMMIKNILNKIDDI